MSRTSESQFQRPSGLRDGVEPKPKRIPTLVLSGTDPVIRFGGSDIVRVSTTSDASGAIAITFGRFDGQRLTLIGWSNGGAAVVSTSSTNVAIDLDWVPETDATLSLIWDAKSSTWIEAARGGDLATLSVTIYDDNGVAISTAVSNDINELSVSDAGVGDALTEIRKLLEKQNELLHKILRHGKGNT